MMMRVLNIFTLLRVIGPILVHVLQGIIIIIPTGTSQNEGYVENVICLLGIIVSLKRSCKYRNGGFNTCHVITDTNSSCCGNVAALSLWSVC